MSKREFTFTKRLLRKHMGFYKDNYKDKIKLYHNINTFEFLLRFILALETLDDVQSKDAAARHHISQDVIIKQEITKYI